jgi:hypothetical protein
VYHPLIVLYILDAFLLGLSVYHGNDVFLFLVDLGRVFNNVQHTVYSTVLPQMGLYVLTFVLLCP